jgi:hypothetical protein
VDGKCQVRPILTPRLTRPEPAVSRDLGVAQQRRWQRVQRGSAIAAVREAENAPLLKQSGDHHVIVSSATAGRLLGLSTSAPPLIEVVEDLLTPARAWP